MRRTAADPEIEARRQGEIPQEVDPEIEALVHDIIGQVADRWTMVILETLHDKGTLRFTRLSQAVEGISQKMLTQTVRQMERDGLVTRTVHPVIPPRVDYALTPLGESLGRPSAACGSGRRPITPRYGRRAGPLRSGRNEFAYSQEPSRASSAEILDLL